MKKARFLLGFRTVTCVVSRSFFLTVVMKVTSLTLGSLANAVKSVEDVVGVTYQFDLFQSITSGVVDSQ
jgi:hypothetical protein